jgi:hypothetical protein
MIPISFIANRNQRTLFPCIWIGLFLVSLNMYFRTRAKISERPLIAKPFILSKPTDSDDLRDKFPASCHRLKWKDL